MLTAERGREAAICDLGGGLFDLKVLDQFELGLLIVHFRVMARV